MFSGFYGEVNVDVLFLVVNVFGVLFGVNVDVFYQVGILFRVILGVIVDMFYGVVNVFRVNVYGVLQGGMGCVPL